MRYRFGSKEKALSFGVCPDVKLADARALRDKAKRALAERRDPGANSKAALTAPAGDTFEAVARDWIKAQSATWTPAHSARILSRFERDLVKPRSLSASFRECKVEWRPAWFVRRAQRQADQ